MSLFCWFRHWTTCVLSRSLTSQGARVKLMLAKTDSQINFQVRFLLLCVTHTRGLNGQICIHNCGQHVYFFLKFLTDEIYRIPLRSDGGFESEYINASFVNVSDAYNYHYTKSNCCTFCSRATSRGMPT